MEENVAIRLKGFIDAMGLSNSQFADQSGIPRPSLSQILTGRNKKISDVIVGQIHAAFPRLSVLWLLFGEGEMLVPERKQESEEEPIDGLFALSDEIPSKISDEKKYLNLAALKEPSNVGLPHVNKGDMIDSKISDLQSQIEKMRKNPRKVVQITVYYDDSTFETFFPR